MGFFTSALAQMPIKEAANALEHLQIAGMTITEAEVIPEGAYTPRATGQPIAGLPAFCRIAATLRPTAQSDIKIEMWLPETIWNGRLLGTGNGGGAGSINYGSLVAGLKQGYATVNTDMGTSRGGATAAFDKPEVWADFGYRATHEMTVAAKVILKTYYGQVAHYAYFVGCSTGGQQALMEAERYPDDYDGIIAGAPANNRTHLHAGFLFNYQVTNPDGKPLFTEKDLAMISNKIINAYAAKSGGAPGDRFLTDPGLVNADFDALFNDKTNNRDSSLSTRQINALKRIYAGPVNPHTKEQIYTSPPEGSENVWGGLSYQQTDAGITGLAYLFKWSFGKDFDIMKFNFDSDQIKIDAILAPLLNANDPDLSALKKKGGKLIMYTGTADPLVPYQDALNYYERVIRVQHGLKKTQDFFRYFLVPGMGHCSGGPGLTGFSHDVLIDLVKWVENGIPPTQLMADGNTCCTAGAPSRFQRPVYPYPLFPKYIGGDISSANSYIPVKHHNQRILKPATSYLK